MIFQGCLLYYSGRFTRPFKGFTIWNGWVFGQTCPPTRKLAGELYPRKHWTTIVLYGVLTRGVYLFSSCHSRNSINTFSCHIMEVCRTPQTLKPAIFQGMSVLVFITKTSKTADKYIEKNSLDCGQGCGSIPPQAGLGRTDHSESYLLAHVFLSFKNWFIF